MNRERLGSRLGFILLSAGCAIGIGNVWKFPYMVGQYGGGAFVVIDLLCLVLLGVPVMTMEFALGRASQKSPVRLYHELAPKGSKWHIHGYAAMAGNYILMMFYTCVAGWMVQYFVEMAKGTFVGKGAAGVADVFSGMLADPVKLTIYMAIVVCVGFAINSLGLQNGVEKLTKVMMVALMAIMVVLAFNSIFMDGGKEGLEFYLKPDLQKMQQNQCRLWLCLFRPPDNFLSGLLKTQSFYVVRQTARHGILYRHHKLRQLMNAHLQPAQHTTQVQRCYRLFRLFYQ